MKNIVTNTFLLVLFATLATGTFFKVYATGSNEKMTICHGTASQTNPYVRIVVSKNSHNGHFNTNGTPRAGHENDILLEGEVDCPNLNTPTPSPSPTPNDGKITICHSTASESNPYVRIVVSKNSDNGHFNTNGTPRSGHQEDILIEGEKDCPNKTENPSCQSSCSENTSTPTSTHAQPALTAASTPVSSDGPAGQVLAALTTLPATGADLPLKIIGQLGLLLIGIVLRKLGR